MTVRNGPSLVWRPGFTRAPRAIGLALALIAAAGFAALAGAFRLGLRAHRPTVTHTTMRAGAWRLDIARATFSGDVACRLVARDARALYMAGAVGFRFGTRQDVTRAVWRIDGGAVHAARDDLPALFDLGAPIDRGGPDDPDQGIVWVPYALLAPGRATVIVIAPRPDKRPRPFRLDGLSALRTMAIAHGCTPDTRFVEN